MNSSPAFPAPAPPAVPATAVTGDPHFLQLDRLTKRYGEVTAVDQVSLEIAQGEVFALLGSSGCGKSTLLRMLAGFESPSAGRILLSGREIAAMPPYERPINMMFQSYALFPHLSVWDNIAFGLKRERLPRAEIATRVDTLLQTVRLAPYARRKPHQLSGGQQQRVALARCLAKNPKLLLLDEPLGALDRKLREQTQIELQAIIKRVGVTCVLVTHDQEEAMALADRIAIMSDGRFLQVGPPKDIYETPSCRFVADFIGNVNLFPGTLVVDEPDHCEIETAHGRFLVGHGITGSLGMEVTLALRPEKIALQRERPAASAHNCVAGTIVSCAYFGSYSRYRVRPASGAELQVLITHADRHAELFEQGETVFACCAPDALVVLTR